MNKLESRIIKAAANLTGDTGTANGNVDSTIQSVLKMKVDNNSKVSNALPVMSKNDGVETAEEEELAEPGLGRVVSDIVQHQVHPEDSDASVPPARQQQADIHPPTRILLGTHMSGCNNTTTMRQQDDCRPLCQLEGGEAGDQCDQNLADRVCHVEHTVGNRELTDSPILRNFNWNTWR